MLTVLKLGGELLEDAAAMHRAAQGVGTLARTSRVIVVHGGGRAIDAELRARGLAPRFVDGIRVTDEPTLDVVVGVLAGRINTRFVAALNAGGTRAVGLTGADAAIGLSQRAEPLEGSGGQTVDPGLVGAPDAAAGMSLLLDLCRAGYLPVIASVGMDAAGTLLNVNADTLASHLAACVGADRLLLAGGTPGVLDGDGRTCERLDEADARAMIAAGTARDGMVAKLRAAITATIAGVRDVRIVDGTTGNYDAAAGTRISAAGALVG
jgi:acetylglutamate kinase